MSTSTYVVKQEEEEEHSTKVSEINVKVVSQLNELDPFFRVRCDEPLEQLMLRWANRAHVQDYKTIRFFLDDKRLDGSKTPNEIGLEDGDCIDAFSDQAGG